MIKKLIQNFFSISFLIFSVSIFLFVYYRSEVFWEGTNRTYYIKYYFLTFFLIILSISSFFISKIIKTYFFISIFSTFFCLYLFEGYLILKVLKINENNKKIYGLEYETRSRLEMYEDLKIQDPNVTVTVSPSVYLKKKEPMDLFPFSGKSKSITIFCNENGYYSIYESDKYGFNNPIGEWDNEEFEYLIIGDSFTHGACVNRPYDIASNLRSLTKKKVLNIGYGGNGPLIEYAALREYLPRNVKNVIWIYMNGDMDNLTDEIKNSILSKYLEDDYFKQNLLKKQNEIDQIVIENIELENSKAKNRVSFSLMNNFLKLYNLRMLILDNSSKKSPDVHPDFEKIILKAKKFSNELGSNFYFVYLPEYSRYKLRDNYDFSTSKEVKKIIKKLDINFIDVHEGVFLKEESPFNLYPFGLNGHYNILGFQKISKYIFDNTK